jgi:hypothetical protein
MHSHLFVNCRLKNSRFAALGDSCCDRIRHPLEVMSFSIVLMKAARCASNRMDRLGLAGLPDS